MWVRGGWGWGGWGLVGLGLGLGLGVGLGCCSFLLQCIEVFVILTKFIDMFAYF